MKIARFSWQGGVRWGVVEDETVYALDGDLYGRFRHGNRLCSLQEVKLMAPCEPRIGIACGRNYMDHIKEMNWPVPEEPNLFFKPLHTVIGTGDDIVYPPISTDLRYEAELCVVMKKRASRLSEAEALDYVLGYTCGNDVTAIDWFIKSQDLTRAKGFDTAGPLGPWLVTDIDPHNLAIKGRVNGETRQDSHTSLMIFTVPTLLRYITAFMTLHPGDVVWTGTPKGGASPVKAGDVIEVEIEGIGVLKNRVVSMG